MTPVHVYICGYGGDYNNIHECWGKEGDVYVMVYA